MEFIGFLFMKSLTASEFGYFVNEISKYFSAVLLRVHKALKEIYPDMLTIIVPRHLEVGQEIVLV